MVKKWKAVTKWQKIVMSSTEWAKLNSPHKLHLILSKLGKFRGAVFLAHPVLTDQVKQVELKASSK